MTVLNKAAASIGASLRGRYDLLLVALITGVGFFLRVWRLESVPPGLHGDEAATGLRADTILHEGWIGVFDLYHGQGQPAGAEYVTAAFLWLFGDSTFVLRFSMALVATATIPLAFILYRMIAGRTVALIAVALLAFSGWHLFFSRIAIPPITMPFFEVLVAVLLLAGLQRKSWWLFIPAGAALGLGIYSYGSYPYFPLAITIFMVYWLTTHRSEITRRLLAQITVTAAISLVVAAPMLWFLRENDHPFEYLRSVSLFSSERYETSDFVGKVDVVLDSGRDFVKRSVFEPTYDGTDGSGVDPMLDPVTSVLLGLGILIALRNWRNPGLTFAVIMLVVLALPGILTTQLGVVRRAVGVVPFIPLLAALPLAYLIEWTTSQSRARMVAYGAGVLTLVVLFLLATGGLLERWAAALVLLAAATAFGALWLLMQWAASRGQDRFVAYAIAAASIAAVLAVSFHGYFETFANNWHSKHVYGWELVATAEYLNGLPEDTVVYFYSSRWSVEYETLRFLSPDMSGSDWSSEFGDSSAALINQSASAVFPEPAEGTGSVYVFLGSYMPEADNVIDRFPSGNLFEGRDADGVYLRAYYLPAPQPP